MERQIFFFLSFLCKQKRKIPLILSKLKLGTQDPLPTSSKPKCTDAAPLSLGCTTGLEPVKHDAK